MSAENRSLVARAADARSLAVRRLLESRGPHAAWEGPIDLNALYGAVFIITLRATALFERDDLQQNGLRPTIKWLLHAQHPDGGVAFASASVNDADHDTTGTVLLTLATARLGGMRLATLDLAIDRAIAFRRRDQNPNRGWGQANEADRDERLAGVGPSTPPHTAYALVGLLRCGLPPGEPTVDRAITYLLETMTPDGRWPNDDAMYTVFPGTLYFSHPLCGPIVVPMALNHHLDACARDPRSGSSLPDEVEDVR